MSETLCKRVWVTGRVQGVWFRASTRDQAERLGITGYANNLADGRVEVLVCGKPERVAELIRWLHQGPDKAKVTHVEVSDVPAGYPVPAGFTTGEGSLVETSD